MNCIYKVAFIAICSTTLAIGCGEDDNNGVVNNGTANNGTANNGTANNGTANNGTANNGTANNGTANNGTANNGTANNGTANNGTANNGTANNGTANNGTANNGGPAVESVDCASVTPDATVSMTDFAFMPDASTISAGQIIEWTNNGDVVHTVTSGVPGDSDSGSVFDSDLVMPGDSTCLQFNDAGAYDYFCSVHPTQMTGTITVQ